jgi:hypothetical protein
MTDALLQTVRLPRRRGGSGRKVPLNAPLVTCHGQQASGGVERSTYSGRLPALSVSNLRWIASASTFSLQISQMRCLDGLPHIVQTEPRGASDRFTMPPLISHAPSFSSAMLCRVYSTKPPE